MSEQVQVDGIRKRLEGKEAVLGLSPDPMRMPGEPLLPMRQALHDYINDVRALLALVACQAQEMADAREALDVCSVHHGHELGRIVALEQEVAELRAVLAAFGKSTGPAPDMVRPPFPLGGKYQ